MKSWQLPEQFDKSLIPIFIGRPYTNEEDFTEIDADILKFKKSPKLLLLKKLGQNPTIHDRLISMGYILISNNGVDALYRLKDSEYVYKIREV